jgi:hypothetical protein
MFSSEVFRLIADEREREVKDLLRVRSLLPNGRRERAIALPPRHMPKARGR